MTGEKGREPGEQDRRQAAPAGDLKFGEDKLRAAIEGFAPSPAALPDFDFRSLESDRPAQPEHQSAPAASADRDRRMTEPTPPREPTPAAAPAEQSRGARPASPIPTSAAVAMHGWMLGATPALPPIVLVTPTQPEPEPKRDPEPIQAPPPPPIVREVRDAKPAAAAATARARTDAPVVPGDVQTAIARSLSAMRLLASDLHPRVVALRPDDLVSPRPAPIQPVATIAPRAPVAETIAPSVAAAAAQAVTHDIPAAPPRAVEAAIARTTATMHQTIRDEDPVLAPLWPLESASVEVTTPDPAPALSEAAMSHVERAIMAATASTPATPREDADQIRSDPPLVETPTAPTVEPESAPETLDITESAEHPSGPVIVDSNLEPDEPAPVVLRAVGLSQGGPGGFSSLDFELRRGEILAFVADHGSGAEALLDILSDDVQAIAGSVTALPGDHAGERRPPTRWRKASLRASVGVIGRTPALASSLTGLQNIIVATQPLCRLRLGRRRIRREIAALQRTFEIRVPLDVPVETLSIAERMLLELLKAIRQGRRILVFDDPLAALALLDAEQLFRTMRLLAAAGMAIILKTRHPEVALTAADRIVVLRMGRIATVLDARNTQRGALAAFLAGRKVERVKPNPRPPGRPVIEMSLVSARGDDAAANLHKVSVSVRAGEIVGIAAMPGNGEHTLALAAAGALRPSSGSLKLHGQVPRHYDAAVFARAGVGYVPREASAEALVPTMSVAENAVLGAIESKSFSRFGLLRARAIRSYAAKLVTGIGVPCSSPTTGLEELSEADRRKLAFWRVINSGPHLIVAHDLASGLDYATRSEAHRQLVAERDDGAAILLISNDIDELLTLSDSIAVLHRGRMSVPQPAEVFDPHRLSLMMSGQGSMAHDWSGWGGAA